MGFYLRKSVKVGPFRFNLSKSRVGVSAGVRGLRFGSGPRGNYVHAGRHGFYYRASLPTANLASPSQVPLGSPQRGPDSDTLIPIESANVEGMVDSSASDLLQEINSKRKRHRFWPWVFALFVVLFPLLGTFSATTSLWGGVFVLSFWLPGGICG